MRFTEEEMNKSLKRTWFTQPPSGGAQMSWLELRPAAPTYFAIRFGAFFFKVVEFHDFCHYEAFLEVGVDLASCLGRLGSFLKRVSIISFFYQLSLIYGVSQHLDWDLGPNTR